MVYDAIGPQHQMQCEEDMEESININDQKFYDYNELSIAVRLLTIKSEGNMKETHPTNNLVPTDYYRSKKIVSKHGLAAEKIDSGVNGCMLFYTDECK